MVSITAGGYFLAVPSSGPSWDAGKILYATNFAVGVEAGIPSANLDITAGYIKFDNILNNSVSETIVDTHSKTNDYSLSVFVYSRTKSDGFYKMETAGFSLGVSIADYFDASVSEYDSKLSIQHVYLSSPIDSIPAAYNILKTDKGNPKAIEVLLRHNMPLVQQE